jgi:putative glutamine amidotransferase
MHAGKPLIGVSSAEHYLLYPDPKANSRRLGVSKAVLAAISQAGGAPVLLDPDITLVADYIERLDGYLLAGGPDVDPSSYHGHHHDSVTETEPEVDAFEAEMLVAASLNGLPTLGLCRGLQLINVARGGTLIAHLPDQPGTLTHRSFVPSNIPWHSALITSGSRLRQVMRRSSVRVNSFHHQAVDRLGDGLVVSARADDGVVEGIEDAAHPFLLAVQWHAEVMRNRAGQRRLFSALIDATGANVRSRPGLVAP